MTAYPSKNVLKQKPSNNFSGWVRDFRSIITYQFLTWCINDRLEKLLPPDWFQDGQTFCWWMVRFASLVNGGNPKFFSSSLSHPNLPTCQGIVANGFQEKMIIYISAIMLFGIQRFSICFVFRYETKFSIPFCFVDPEISSYLFRTPKCPNMIRPSK